MNRIARYLDALIIWPGYRESAATLAEARSAFAIHVRSTRAWMVLGEVEVSRVIEQLGVRERKNDCT